MSRKSEDNLEAAFELISDFKDGNIQPGSDISEQQFKLLKLLRADLLPNEPDLDGDIQKLAVRVAEEDTRWNRKAMQCGRCDLLNAFRWQGERCQFVTTGLPARVSFALVQRHSGRCVVHC